ncbi:hypothetical protein IID24_04820, partial [Patescibacteria group bacterium]|nr:hypothetical protein [Patescibacteria group bacterium]
MDLLKGPQQFFDVKIRKHMRFYLFFVFMGVCAVVASFIAFPYQETRNESIQLLPGNHTLAQKLSIHESPPITISNPQDFLRLVDGQEMDVIKDGSSITYRIVREGNVFQHIQWRSSSFRLASYDYRGEDVEIRDGELISTHHRDWFMMKALGIVLLFLVIMSV